MIQNIDINKLHNHPKNPRKDLGDLAELADSIKAQGILQNLTVVPWFSTITGVGADDPKHQEELGYFVVIGNRRLAAAKIAGLTELPCVISGMDHKTQVGTMLLENMQRADLTIYEQAQGFQMLLDFGESVSDIAEQTGFSSTTVRRRVKLLELDAEKFKASAERNVTLTDYAELEKVEDIELRNKVLNLIGTPNFKYELQRAIDKEKADKNLAIYVEQLNTFATQIDDPSGMRYISSYYLYRSDNNGVKKPSDAGTVKYYYIISNYGSIALYAEAIETKASKAQDKKQKEQQKEFEERRAALEEISKRAFQLRRDFVREVSNAKAKNNISSIIKHNINAMLECTGTDINDLADFLGVDIEDETEEERFNVFIQDEISEKPERYLFLVTYLSMDSENETYTLLEKLGYEMSDEERALQNRTHELFIVKG